jgi:pre-rRNA-processing protein TSR3
MIFAEIASKTMKVNVLMLKQDDPRKCTAAKLVKFGLAKAVGRTQNDTILLDPFAKTVLLRQDAKNVSSITAVDCSWNLAENAFSKRFSGLLRKLPPLLAGNPVNYAKLGKLTTVEAIAAAAYILGYVDLAAQLLDKFNWGHTFLELNENLLADYSALQSEDQILPLLSEYGLVNNH